MISSVTERYPEVVGAREEPSESEDGHKSFVTQNGCHLHTGPCGPWQRVWNLPEEQWGATEGVGQGVEHGSEGQERTQGNEGHSGIPGE